MSAAAALRLLPVALAAVGTIPFLPALQAGFVNWDDPANILNNEGFRGLGPAQLRWMFTTPLIGHYIPLTWMTLGLNYVLGGMNPWGYHLGNLLLHGANVALFYLVARRLLAAGFEVERHDGLSIVCGAAAAALVFGLHPLRAESVVWVTERRDVLCAGFYLLAVLAYLRGAAGGGLVRGRWLAMSLAALGAALLSKAMAMTLPATLLLLDLYPLRRSRLGWRALLREKVPYALLAALGAAVAVLAVSRGAGWTGYEAYGPRARVAMVAYSLWFYPSRLVWAHGLSPLYELSPRIDVLQWRFLGPVLGLLAVTAILLRLVRRFPGGLTAWVHSAIVLSPVSGIVHAGHQLAHDRYSYLSGLGFALLGGAGLSWATRAWRRGRLPGWAPGLVAAVAVLTLVGWGAAAWRQSRIWLSSETLWQAAVDVDPECGICRNNLGAAIVGSQRLDLLRLRDAEAQFRMGITLRPAYADAYVNLAAVLVLQGRPREAEPVLRTFMGAFPDLSDGPLRLGMLLRDLGQDAEAVPLLRQALRMSPGSASARQELGKTLANQGARLLQAGASAAAIPLIEEAVALLSADALPLRNLGQALVEQGRSGEAISALGRALALSPRDPAVRYWLVRAHRGAGEPAAAEPHLAVLRELDARLAALAERGR